MKINSVAIVNTIFSAVVGGFVTWGVTSYITQEQGKTRYVDYDITNKAIFKSEQKILENKLKVIIGNNINKPVKEVSQITFTLFNFSDKDFEKLKLNIELSQSENNIKSFQILSQEISKEYRDSTKQAIIKAEEGEVSKKYSYVFEQLNRSDTAKSRSGSNLDKVGYSSISSYFGILPVFQVTYTLAGENLDDIKITPIIVGTGVRSRETSFNTAEEYKIISQGNFLNLMIYRARSSFPYLIILILLIIYSFLIYATYQVLEYLRKSRKDRYKKDFIIMMTNEFSKSNFQNKLHEISDPDTLAQEIVKSYRELSNKESDQKFFKILVSKLSQSNEIERFNKLTNMEIAQELFELNQ
jgi:hypothetical protein